MTLTEVAAWIGAVSGMGGVFWNVYLKLTSGPKLDVTATAGMVQMPPPRGDPLFMMITVRNRGTAATTLTNVCLSVFDSWWKRKRNNASLNFIVLNSVGPPLPLKLEVGDEWRTTMKQDDGFDELLRTNQVWCGICHSFDKHPVYAPIQKPQDPTQKQEVVPK